MDGSTREIKARRAVVVVVVVSCSISNQMGNQNPGAYITKPKSGVDGSEMEIGIALGSHVCIYQSSFPSLKTVISYQTTRIYKTQLKNPSKSNLFYPFH